MKVRNRTVEKEEHMSRDRIDRLYEAIRRADQAYEVWAAAHGLTLYELQIYYEMMKNEGEAIRQKDLCKTLDAERAFLHGCKSREQEGKNYIIHK